MIAVVAVSVAAAVTAAVVAFLDFLAVVAVADSLWVAVSRALARFRFSASVKTNFFASLSSSSSESTTVRGLVDLAPGFAAAAFVCVSESAGNS